MGGCGGCGSIKQQNELQSTTAPRLKVLLYPYLVECLGCSRAFFSGRSFVLTSMIVQRNRQNGDTVLLAGAGLSVAVE